MSRIDDGLGSALDRFSRFCVEEHANKEIIRYWNDRVRQNDCSENRTCRKLAYELIYADVLGEGAELETQW